ncbi:MAG: hypothetical protein JG774_1163 [Desulfomicrobiaceae bacterium]|jgi:uncharacterized protein YcbK (DUF882 family)|nr:DUF882 domain-containing protein [Desulfomicrobiaceae bacterium]MBZ4685418.1 hypothetical protein [Desulfomicrobiaceae bacterium]MDK2873451.1 hypothetical protein [Desulfomicrobiaceae bacterium]HCF06087.1 twin-arginine translocation pathway signal protein [Desulfomicrobiaceae bacterium]
MLPSRRDFLRRISSVAAACAVAVVVPGVVHEALASPVPRKRVLLLENLHTGKRLEVAYAVNGRYTPEALKTLNQFLRDPRNGATTRMDPRLFDLLHLLWVRLGAKTPYHVVSAYRSPSTNAQMRRKSRGVARNSYHMRGKAMDVYLPGVPLARLRDAALAARMGGVGFYPRDGFVHLDTGPVRHW